MKINSDRFFITEKMDINFYFNKTFCSFLFQIA